VMTVLDIVVSVGDTGGGLTIETETLPSRL